MLRRCRGLSDSTSESSLVILEPAARISFIEQFRNARADVLKDSEAVAEVLNAIERLGSLLINRIGDLGKFERILGKLAEQSSIPTAAEPPRWRQYHSPFRELYGIVRQGRNEWMHQGAFARSLASHAVMLCLTLEDALMHGLGGDSNLVSDFMVRNVVVAERWQPISFARQQMLANSFSFLPIKGADNEWHLLSDLSVARFLDHVANRKEGMARTIEEAHEQQPGIFLPAVQVPSSMNVHDALSEFVDCRPILCYDEKQGRGHVIGIRSAFDCL